MNRCVFIGILALTSFSCQSQEAQTSDNSVKNALPSMSNSIVKSKNEQRDENIGELVETFSDDSKIGVPHKNKIEISEFTAAESYRVELKFYSLAENKKWKLKQTIKTESGAPNPNVRLKDFNNDGFKDVAYQSELAARGANVIERLYVYDKKKDELVFIKNSEDYPNLNYNKTLNCIDAQRFYGGTATEFLRIEGETLKEFASVETFGTQRKVSVVDRRGKEKLLRTDKVPEDWILERYKTFNPPRIYTAGELAQ